MPLTSASTSARPRMTPRQLICFNRLQVMQSTCDTEEKGGEGREGKGMIQEGQENRA